MRPLDRLRDAFEALHLELAAVEADRAFCHQGLQYLHGFREPLDPYRRWIEVDARRLVLPLQPTRTKTQLEPAIGEEIQAGGLLREHHRVPIVDAE